MRKMVLLLSIAVVSFLYACSNIDGIRDMTANGGGDGNSSIDTPGDGSSTNPSVTHQLSFQEGLTVQYKAVPVNIDDISEVSYDWDFGDGKYAENTGAETTHKYEKGATYNVTVKLKKGGVQLAEYSNPYTINEEQGLVNNVLLAEPDVSDKLTYYFYATAASTDNVNYTWDFGDNSETESTGSDNTNTYTFPKYGKTYPVTVTSDTGYNTLDSTVLINIPGVTVDMECSTSGLSVICTPILPPEIPDMTVEWDCGNGEPPVTTVGNEVVVCNYDENDTDVTIKVEGSDDKLEEPVKDEEHFTVSKLFGMNVTERRAVSEDKLTWQITVNGDLKAVDGVLPEGYKVQYRFDYGDGKGFGQWKDADENYDITDTYTFSRYPANGKTGYDVKVEAQVIKGELEPEKSSTNTKFDIAAPTASLTTESVTNVDGFGQKFCVKWDDASYLPAGSLKYTWNFGDGNGTTGNDTTGQCQTHVYKNTGKYDITVDIVSNDGKFDAGYVKQLKDSVTFKQEFTGLNAPITITPYENNPLKYTISSNVTSSSTDGSGNVGSDALEYTWEIGTGNEKVTKTGQTFTYDFPKYGKNYPVKLTVTLKGTEISTTANDSVVISRPVLKIETTQSIINLDQQSTWTSSITYNNKDIVLNNGFEPIYQWSATGETISNNGATLNHTFKSIGQKTVTLNVTSSQFDETLTATGNVEVIDPVEFKEIQITCNNDQWDAVKYTCSGKLIDQKGKEITDQSFSIDWKVANVNPAISTTSKSSEEVELILDWPTNRKANETPSRDFTTNVVVKQNGSEVGSKTQKLTVKRAITYTASLAGYNDSGTGRTAVINFSNIKGPEAGGKIRYNWQYNFKNRNNQKISNTFSTSKDITSHNFNNVIQQISYIGSVKGDPFAGGNGIGLKIEGLSKELTIYGVTGTYAVFGPNFTFDRVANLQPQNPTLDQMKGVVGTKGWYVYGFIHGFRMNEQFPSGSFNNVLKAEIRNTNNIKPIEKGNSTYATSIIVTKSGMNTTSPFLALQTSLVYNTIHAYLDVYGYHTSSDALKDSSQYIKMGETEYLYNGQGMNIWFPQWGLP